MKDRITYLKGPNAAVFMVVLLSVLYFPLISKAESPFGPVALATGRARVASNDDGTQVLSNPAALVHAGAFTTAVFYQGGMSEESERTDRFTGTMTDNGEDIFAAGGFLYSQGKESFKTAADFEEKRYQGSFAKFLFSHVSMGTSIYRIERKLETGESFEFWDVDLGFLWNPIADFAVGARFDGMAKHDESVPAHVAVGDRATIGANYLFMPQFRGRIDLTRRTDLATDWGGDWDIRAGVESTIDAFLILRFGYEEEASMNRSHYSAGFGFTGPRLKIDYAYRQNVDFSGGAMHGVDFRLPL